ncbi:MAG: hypothetical protein ABR579_06385 [Actinomycetota bacterium]
MLSPTRYWRFVIGVALISIMAGAALSGSVATSAPAIAHEPVIVGGPMALTHTSTARSPYASPTDPYAGPTPDIPCDQGSMPEKVQGKAPKADYDSGRAAKGYFCNARLVGHTELSGGYRV